MLFTKVGVYKAEIDGAFIVELGHEADNQVHPIHTSSPLARDEVRNLLRHVELSDKEIEQFLVTAGSQAGTPKRSSAAAR